MNINGEPILKKSRIPKWLRQNRAIICLFVTIALTALLGYFTREPCLVIPIFITGWVLGLGWTFESWTEK